MIRTFCGALFSGALVLLCCSGCFFSEEPYHETCYYDLHLPDAPASGVPIAVGTFRNVTPVRQRMSYRRDQSQLFVDEYNRWTQSPERMLQRYLSAAFGSTSLSREDAEIWDLEGTLVIFEIDLDDGDVTIGLNYELRRGDQVRHGNLTVLEPFKESTPAEFAAAASRAADRIACELRTVALAR